MSTDCNIFNNLIRFPRKESPIASANHEVMSEPFNVTIDGANPTYWNYTLYDDGKNRWIYFEYEHTTREIVIITEFPSILIQPLFMMATLLALIIYRRKSI